MWKREKTLPPKYLTMPHGYSFEFEVRHNQEHPVHKNTKVAVLIWTLYRHDVYIKTGKFNISMGADHVREKIFLSARNEARMHAKELNESVDFPYSDKGTHVIDAGSGMEIPGSLLNRFNYYYED